MTDLAKLQTKLGYHFNNIDYLNIALTHRSKGGDHNERYEFLGDAVVNFVIAEILFQQNPAATEGELSRWRAALVNRDALADIAARFELGQYMALGVGEVKSGGHARPSILSCAMEAVIGAIYLDGGFEEAKRCIDVMYHDLVNALSDAASHKDPKTRLQEYLQSQRMMLPLYKIESVEGEAHQQMFKVSCRVEQANLTTMGEGTSRRKAEQSAADAMLAKIVPS